jgi:phosphoglycolate phosphatase-like HAD superfamily hydrolase
VFKTEYMSGVVPFPGVQELFDRLRADGHQVVLGTSAKGEELERYLKLIGIEEQDRRALVVRRCREVEAAPGHLRSRP